MKNTIRHEYELLLTLITHTEDFIYIKDCDSKFLLCNMATARLMGASHPQELTNKTDFDFYPHDLASRYYNDEQEIVRTGKYRVNYEEPLIDHLGNPKYIVTTKVPFKNNAGQIIGIIGIGKDITERKKAEEILKRDKDTLEQLAHQRAEELLAVQVQLDQAKRLADIGTLASMVAHELRNPLVAIRVVMTSMRRKIKEPQLESYLTLIEKKIAESDQIINNLLFYSRIKAPHQESLSVNGIIKECLDVLRGRAQKNITISDRFALKPDIMIDADPVQLREVINNILNNAYDAVDDARGAIEVDGEDDGQFAYIYIKDNGPGITQESLEKVFEPFYTTKARGTGLGLAVCRHIIKLHGGTMRLESAPGKGTRAVIKLPRKRKSDL